MYEQLKREVIQTALEIKDYGLIALAGGNVSARTENGQIVVTPSGINYEIMKPNDVLVLSKDGDVIEGTLRPSVDTTALLYIYDHMPDVNAIIHTHQPYASAVGLIHDNVFPVASTTLANVTLGAVPIAPYSAAASEQMGIETVTHIGDKRAVILKHHGVVTVGGTLKDALYAAIYMEEAAKSYLAAKAAGNVALMSPQQVAEAVETHRSYGQK